MLPRRFRETRLRLPEKGRRLRLEQYPVDGLKLNGGFMEVHQLRQGIPGGVMLPLGGGESLPDALPALLCGGQAVIPVPHGVEHRRRRVTVLLPQELRVRHAVQGVPQLLRPLAGNPQPPDVPAPQHQGEVVQGLPGVLGGQGRGLEFRVVVKQYQVGTLQRCLPAQDQTGRDALLHQPLRGVDQGDGILPVVVGFQIQQPQDPPAETAAGEGAFHVDVGILQGAEKPPGQIVLHGGQYGFCPLLLIRQVQIGLRQHEAQRAGGVTHQLFHLCPVFRLRGELVAGDNGPAFHIRVPWEQDVTGNKDILQDAYHSI